MRRCRFCALFELIMRDYGDCPHDHNNYGRVRADMCCSGFRSAALLPESYVDLTNITESEEAQRLYEVGA